MSLKYIHLHHFDIVYHNVYFCHFLLIIHTGSGHDMWIKRVGADSGQTVNRVSTCQGNNSRSVIIILMQVSYVGRKDGTHVGLSGLLGLGTCENPLQSI